MAVNEHGQVVLKIANNFIELKTPLAY